MPKLVWMKRRWAISSDDFILPFLTELCLRFVRFVGVLALYNNSNLSQSCDTETVLLLVYMGNFLLNLTSILLLWCGIYITCQGTIRDDYPRRHFGLVLHGKHFLFLCEIVWLVICTHHVFVHGSDCDAHLLSLVKFTLIVLWIHGCMMVVGLLVTFDMAGVVHEDEENLHVNMGSLTAHNAWLTRCRLLCCCIARTPKIQETFSDIAKLLADFEHGIDLSPTDVAAGLILVKHEQDHHICKHGSTSFFLQPGPTPQPWMTVENAAYYMKYAWASYGWTFYTHEHIFSAIKRMNQYVMCKCVSDKYKPCRCKMAPIKTIAGATDDMLVYADFNNDFEKLPFYVVADKIKCCVVVSIRGTLSQHDVLVDAVGRGSLVDVDNLSKYYCHESMLHCAEYIRDQLLSHNVLEQAFDRLNYICCKQRPSQEIDVVITGHSLGAGVAAVLVILLQKHFPQAKCFSYSPPGGLMSENVSKYSERFTCSVVLGDDIVPRLGMLQLTDLKLKIITALCKCSVPKYIIMATGLLRIFTGALDELPTEEESKENVENCLLKAQRKVEKEKTEMCHSNWPLYPAGCVLHVMQTNPGNSKGEPDYEWMWAYPQSYSRIILSSRMVDDHHPNSVFKALNKLVEKQQTFSA